MECSPLVYVVDDNRSVARALKRLIESLGLEAEAYSSPHAFLEIPVIRRCGCMVLDVKMPDMTGFELYEHMAELGRALPVIFMTASASMCDAERAKDTGAVAYLEKPFEYHAMEDAIRVAIEAP